MYESNTMSLENLEIHDLAALTPVMTELTFNALKDSIEANGQQVPVVIWRGKLIDGRHRCKALRELGITEVKYVSEDSSKTEEDISILITDVFENRRHQTTTQKAIMAYNSFIKAKEQGVKLSQGKAASAVGSTRLQLSRVIKLAKLTDDAVLKRLFEGHKINIGTKAKPCNTDSLAALINYFESRVAELLEQSSTTKVSEDFTDEELASLNETMLKLSSQYSTRMLERLNSMLFYNMKNDRKASYDKEEVSDE